MIAGFAALKLAEMGHPGAAHTRRSAQRERGAHGVAAEMGHPGRSGPGRAQRQGVEKTELSTELAEENCFLGGA